MKSCRGGFLSLIFTKEELEEYCHRSILFCCFLYWLDFFFFFQKILIGFLVLFFILLLFWRISFFPKTVAILILLPMKSRYCIFGRFP